MFTTLDEALTELAAAFTDAAADMPGVEPDYYAYDVILAVAYQCDEKTAKALCRYELGYVPEHVPCMATAT